MKLNSKTLGTAIIFTIRHIFNNDFLGICLMN